MMIEMTPFRNSEEMDGKDFAFGQQQSLWMSVLQLASRLRVYYNTIFKNI